MLLSGLGMPAGKVATAGHAGSNDGWTSVMETIPATGDALVVLITSEAKAVELAMAVVDRN